MAEGAAPDPVELTHWLAERIPYFMVPRYIRFVDALPKTPTERVQKVKLREQGITARHLRPRGRRHHDRAVARPACPPRRARWDARPVPAVRPARQGV